MRIWTYSVSDPFAIYPHLQALKSDEPWGRVLGVTTPKAHPEPTQFRNFTVRFFLVSIREFQATFFFAVVFSGFQTFSSGFFRRPEHLKTPHIKIRPFLWFYDRFATYSPSPSFRECSVVFFVYSYRVFYLTSLLAIIPTISNYTSLI